MKTSQKVLEVMVAAAVLGGVAIMAQAGDRKSTGNVPSCYEDKNLNGKCDKSHAEGGECPKFHARPLTAAEKKKLEEMKKKAGGGKTLSLVTCPGQGLCMACGLCSGNA